ncbi:MAG: hypothetical protein PHP96_03585 [Candidatus Dojkabacteria bacterium]|jgi:hypothetical protein|nr:hypothetical protein [Candidatus Dojkabacteria bacterium]MDD2578431.1 hypothetical protein [Candidatus Dojkabacteria bacterium]HNW32735.1 hypothetical protein [Candidatus Dojkabacteria bacterium]HOZ44520.1 hypothetical protein [Candidatus Dojkabacteria bacterium]HRY74194.1 hypothetical protein [Candidatus Dojkabacteria bacterium]
MDKNARARTTASTQDHLAIRDIRDDLIINRNGSVAMVIQTSAINFDLLAEYEQDNKILAFAGLLNSLNFRIQIMIRTKRIDITNYITYLQSQEKQAMSEGLKKQLNIYTKFVKNLIVQNDVLDKSFFIVVPYHTGTIVPTTTLIKGKKSKEEEEKNQNIQTDQLIEKAKIFLFPKRDHILKQLGRMGLFGHQLTTKELITEFYTIYNPEEE